MERRTSGASSSGSASAYQQEAGRQHSSKLIAVLIAVVRPCLCCAGFDFGGLDGLIVSAPRALPALNNTSRPKHSGPRHPRWCSGALHERVPDLAGSGGCIGILLGECARFPGV